MAFTDALRLVIDADTQGAVRGIEKVGATAERELGRSEERLDRWGSKLTSLGAGMVAFGGAALVGLGALAKQSEEANLAQVKLQNTIDNMPKLAGATASEFTDLAESIQKVTAADADAIVEAEAMLGTFRLTADQIKDITPLVVDYSRKFGVDMVSAAVQVGKALDGNVVALKRNGVSIDEAVFATDRYRAVQEALSDQVGGFAEAEGKTFAGSLERMKNELGDLAEGVGGGAVDAFTSMFGAVESVASALEGISPGTQNLIGKIATFGSVGIIAAGGLNILVGQAIAFRSSLATIGEVASTTTAKLGGLKNVIGVGGLATAITAAAGALELYNQQQQQSNISKGTAEFLAAGDSVAKMRDVLSTLAKQGPAEFIGTFQQLAETNRVAAERFLGVAEAAGVSDRVLRQMREALDTTSAAQSQNAEDTAAATGAIDENADAADGAAEATDRLTEALQRHLDALAAEFDPLFGMISALQSQKNTLADVADAQSKLDEALAAGDPEAIADAHRDYDAALSQAGESLLDVQRAQAELNTAIEHGDVNLAEAQDQMFNWAIQAGFTADEALAMAGQLGGAADEARALGEIDPVVTVQTEGMPAASRDAAILADQINKIPREVNIITRLSTVLAGSTNVPTGHAHGGTMAAGEIGIVGELGPELFVAPQSGRIMPAGSWSVGGGGTTVVYNLSFNGPTNDRQVVESIKRFERSNGSGWRN